MNAECGTSVETGKNNTTVPTSPMSGKALLNCDFDCDIDGLLCLTPSCTSHAGRSSDSAERCKIHSPDDLDKELRFNASVARNVEDEGGYFSLENSLDSSYESTDLPPVKVKSVVVVPGRPSSHPELNRPVVFKQGVDWENERRRYVHSVNRHMNESPANTSVVTELQDLMTNVAGQTTGTKGGHWQHPSDLTIRNYRRRDEKNLPKMSSTHRRFRDVPTIFERSPYF